MTHRTGDAARGVLRDPLRNRGAAFDDDQRGQLGLTRRLPSAVETLDGPAAYLSINRLVDIKPPCNRWSWPDDIDPERPIIINKVLHCATFLGDACDKLCEYSVEDTNLDCDQIASSAPRSSPSPPVPDEFDRIVEPAARVGDPRRDLAVSSSQWTPTR